MVSSCCLQLIKHDKKLRKQLKRSLAYQNLNYSSILFARNISKDVQIVGTAAREVDLGRARITKNLYQSYRFMTLQNFRRSYPNLTVLINYLPGIKI